MADVVDDVEKEEEVDAVVGVVFVLVVVFVLLLRMKPSLAYLTTLFEEEEEEEVVVVVVQVGVGAVRSIAFCFFLSFCGDTKKKEDEDGLTEEFLRKGDHRQKKRQKFRAGMKKKVDDFDDETQTQQQ